MKYQSMKFLFVFLLVLGMHQEVVDAQLEPYTNLSLQRQLDQITNPRTGGLMTSRILSEMEVHGSTLDYRLPSGWGPERGEWWANYDHQVQNNQGFEKFYYHGYAPYSAPYFGTGILPFLELFDALVKIGLFEIPSENLFNYISIKHSLRSSSFGVFKYILSGKNSKGSDPKASTRLSAIPWSLNNREIIENDQLPYKFWVVNDSKRRIYFQPGEIHPLIRIAMAKGYRFYWDDSNNQCGYNHSCVSGKQGKFVFKEDDLQDRTSENITIAAIYGDDIKIQNNRKQPNSHILPDPKS